MGLSMSLYDENEECVCDINWLRNPFGLAYWAETNTRLSGIVTPDLYDVCNQWSYDKADDVDVEVFAATVHAYDERVQALEVGYFWFHDSAWRQFINEEVRFAEKISTVEPVLWEKDGERLRGLNQELFSDYPHMGGHNSLDHYKQWFGRLVEFADLLKTGKYSFYCSN